MRIVLSYRLILQDVPWSGLERQPGFQGVPGGEKLEVVRKQRVAARISGFQFFRISGSILSSPEILTCPHGDPRRKFPG
jgi:hypothetical protein